MGVYLISYDIKVANDFEYQPLWDALKELGAQKAQLSLWLLANDALQADVFAHFQAFLRPTDKLLVVEMIRRPSVQQAFTGTAAFLDATGIS